MDRSAAFVLLIALLPLLMLLSLCTAAVFGSFVFTQLRIGYGERTFRILKLQTMYGDRENLLSEEQRIPPFGRFLRRTGLDELPQLLNVLMGQMSFVGPRPLLPEYLSLYSEEQRKRHTVKPGITGWAQVNGRNSLNWEELFLLDIEYTEKQSFGFDQRILWITLRKLFAKPEEGENRIREPFSGKQNETFKPEK